jgi:hypothetical protein
MLGVLAKSIAELFDKLMAILHSLSRHSRSLTCLQVFVEQCCLTGLGYAGLVLIESQLDFAGRRWHVVYVQVELDG